MSETFLKRAVKKHFLGLSDKENMSRIKLGNSEIDGEAHASDGQKTAVEIKTATDDAVRGLGQLAEGIAYGYGKAVSAATIRKVKKIDQTIFKHFGWKLYGVDLKGKVHKIRQLPKIAMPLFTVKKEVFTWIRTGQKTIGLRRGKAKQGKRYS